MILESSYRVKTDNTTIPFSLAEVNGHLKESFTDLSTETYLKVLMQAVKQYGEQLTGRTFLNKTFLNYRSHWEYQFELRQSKLVSITSVKYVDEDGTTQTVSSANYSTTLDDDYSTLYFVDDYIYPSLNSNNPQRIIIEFIAGFGTAETNIPMNLKTAMLQHLAQLWKWRGDCNPAEKASLEGFLDKHLPPASKLIYSMEKIIDILI